MSFNDFVTIVWCVWALSCVEESVFVEQQGVYLLFNERLDNLFATSVSSVEFSTGGCEFFSPIFPGLKHLKGQLTFDHQCKYFLYSTNS